jgi:4'-phosphopantetheinyl transferase
VWLGASAAANRKFLSLLSPEEVQRSRRFSTEALTTSYVTSHGVLRTLLSRYLKLDAHKLEFAFGPAGKPALMGDFKLRFNMSHSGGLAVYAFASSLSVGIDIEEIRKVSDAENIAKHHFCSEETNELLSITDEKQRTEAFFRCWTRKESYIKAVGDGLSSALNRFQVTLLPGVPPSLIHIENSKLAASGWTLRHIEPAAGYVGAVAYQSRDHRFEMHPLVHAQEILNLL